MRFLWLLVFCFSLFLCFLLNLRTASLLSILYTLSLPSKPSPLLFLHSFSGWPYICPWFYLQQLHWQLIFSEINPVYSINYWYLFFIFTTIAFKINTFKAGPFPPKYSRSSFNGFSILINRNSYSCLSLNMRLLQYLPLLYLSYWRIIILHRLPPKSLMDLSLILYLLGYWPWSILNNLLSLIITEAG